MNPALARLTPRQQEIAGLLTQGLTQRAIAKKLGLDWGGVGTQIQLARKRLKCKTVFQMMYVLGTMNHE